MVSVKKVGYAEPETNPRQEMGEPPPVVSGEDYIESLRRRGLAVYLFGERVEEPVDHPTIPDLLTHPT